MLINSGFTNMKPNSAMVNNNFNTGSRMAEPEVRRKPDITNKQITSLLSQYKSHGLNDLNNASLMNGDLFMMTDFTDLDDADLDD